MKKILFIIIIFLFSFSYSNALIKVDITRGNLDPLPIAVSPLHVDESSDKSQQIDIKKLGINISSIIEKILNQPVSLIHLSERLLFKNLILHI